MYHRLKGRLGRLLTPLNGESGQTLTEYGLLLLLLAVACAAALGLFGLGLLDRWQWVSDQLPF